MKVINKEKKLCLICMEEHEVQTVSLNETEEFKGKKVSFEAVYEYCDVADEFLETEEMIRANSLVMKDAYRGIVGLLTSGEIIAIRDKYGVSQKDFSEILSWGGATIARYESGMVQTKVQDLVLRKIKEDPEWFLDLLAQAKGRISGKAYNKYYSKAKELYGEEENTLLISLIHAVYSKYKDEEATGRVDLNLVKVIEMVNYIAAQVNSLYKVKLMKLLWYSDALHYKRHGKAISGLVYCALPMGAVPEGHEYIMMLDGVCFDTVQYEDIAYKFYSAPDFEIKELNSSEIETLDKVISELGNLSTRKIVKKMHQEVAYRHTDKNCVIPFSLAAELALE